MKDNKHIDWDVALREFLCGDRCDIEGTFRVPKKIASGWMLENKTVITHGKVHYLAIKDLGLNVCEVGLRPGNKVNTFMVKNLQPFSDR